VIALSDLAALPGIDALFGVKLSQHARLITLATSQDSALPQALVAERFTGREGVNELFDFEIDALSTSTDLDLAAFIGEEITLGLLQPDGSRRAWHGLCVDAQWLGADGGLARYRLHLPRSGVNMLLYWTVSMATDFWCQLGSWIKLGQMRSWVLFPNSSAKRSLDNIFPAAPHKHSFN